MNDRYLHNAWLTGLLIVLSGLVMGCSDNSEPDVQQGQLLQIRSLTRSSDDLPVPVGTMIRLCLLQGAGDDVGEEAEGGFVTYAGKDAENKDVWNSGVYVKGDTKYFIYGYMPSSLVEGYDITAGMTGTTVTGANLTLNGLSALSNEDFCIVIGVKAGEDGTVQPGEFSYTTTADNNNGITLLIDHLYAQVNFRVLINPEYNKLRTIKLKSLKLTGSSNIMTNKVNATITLENGTTKPNPVNSITMSSIESSGVAELTFYQNDNGCELKTTFDENDPDRIEVAGNFLPHLAKDLSLVSIYDVYDKQNHLIRENCHAENKLDVVISNIQRGQIRPVTLTVNPTYLYVLSEPDLENPTVKIN